MRITKDGIVAPFRADIVERPWGHYGLYADNEPCTTKILFIKSGAMLSLQYHFLRSQFYMLLDDDFTIEYSTKPVPDELAFEPNEDLRIAGFQKFLEDNLVTEKGYKGDMFGFQQKIIHRTQYNGKLPFGYVLDVAFGVNDEEDIVRIKDLYGRGIL
jgi:mannose-1-phosphate guanylyltransferase